MRYGLIADSAFEQRLLQSPLAPRATWDTLIPLLQAKAVMICSRLRIFEMLDATPQDATSLARALDVDEEVLSSILRLLTSAGYLQLQDDRFNITPHVRNSLVTNARVPRTAHVAFMESLWNAIGKMEDVLRTGTSADLHSDRCGMIDWSVYQEAMLENAKAVAALLVPLVPVAEGAKRLLDIAGSHGLYGALICRAHPPMRAEVLELPDAVEHSRNLAQALGIDDVVSHRTGNALTSPLGSDWDVVLINNLLHHLTPHECQTLLRKVRASMRPGGTVVIWEWRAPESSEPPDTFTDGMALFFRTISRGRCHRSSEYAEWLGLAQFSEIAVRRSIAAPHHCAIIGKAC